MEFINEAVLHAAGQWWIYPLLLVFFFVDGFAMVVPSETLIVALAAYSLHSGQPNLWILGLTALVGAMAGDNMAYMLGRKIGLERFRWMRKPKVQKVFAWANYELEKRGAVLIFTARYIPWGRVAVNYVAGTTAFPHRRFFVLDAFACVTWVGYSIGIGVLASSFPWLHHNPLLSAGIAVVFAIVLGVLIDHLLRWWHKRLGRHDARPGTADGVPAQAPAAREHAGGEHPAQAHPAQEQTVQAHTAQAHGANEHVGREPQGHAGLLAGRPTEAGASTK